MRWQGFPQELCRDGHRLRKAMGVGESVLGLWFQCGRCCWLWKHASSLPTQKWRRWVCSQRKFPKPSGNSLLTISTMRYKHCWTVTPSWVMVMSEQSAQWLRSHEDSLNRHYLVHQEEKMHGPVRKSPPPPPSRKKTKLGSSLISCVPSGKLLNLSEPQKWGKEE